MSSKKTPKPDSTRKRFQKPTSLLSKVQALAKLAKQIDSLELKIAKMKKKYTGLKKGI